MMMPQGCDDQFEDMMMFPFSELSDMDDIPEQNSSGLDMLDELPEIQDTDVTTAMIEDSSYMVPETSSTSCSEIFLANPSFEFGTLTSSISIPATDPALNHWSSLLNFRQSAVPAAPPLSSFLREPFTGPSIECHPPNYFSPIDHENLKAAGPRARKRCTHDEVRVRVKDVSDYLRRSKKAKVVMIADDSAGNLNDVEKSKERIRVGSNAEHVVRERQRRDDMAGKYNILESMLPASSASSKRERAAIVVDAILLLKDLQHRKQELLNRRSQMKHLESLRVVVQPRAVLANEFAAAAAGTCSNVIKIANHEQDIHHVNQFSPPRQVSCCETAPSSGSKDNHQKAAAATNSISPHDTDIINHGQYDRALHSISTRVNEIAVARRRISRTMIQAHGSGLLDDEEIHIEVVCRQPRSDFQSLLIQSVESLSLEVHYCSFFTLQPQRFVRCVVTAKPVRAHAQAEIQSSASIIDALQAALEHIEH